MPRAATIAQADRRKVLKKPIETCHISVGIRIRMIRETLGLTQDEISKRVGLERTSIANIESGRQRLSLEDIEVFSSALGTSPKNLIKGIWW